VGTHFQSEDDTISVALDNIYSWYSGPVTIVTDLVVLNVSKSQIRERRAVVPTSPGIRLSRIRERREELFFRNIMI